MASPLVNAFASPVMIRRKRGIAVTLPTGEPTNFRVTWDGVWISPVFWSLPPPSALTSSSSCPFCRRSTGQ
ncbi:hypothetical protein SMICM17S_12314 [Streptomyces microflavus]